MTQSFRFFASESRVAKKKFYSLFLLTKFAVYGIIIKDKFMGFCD